ncbi:tetratricopeptide repeat domain containing protein [Acanthamoeba castellanii str. Neff]|uniref:Tetratricopeptide repeat domain containing protein n=1 Tax=Acanthamoeba castellanii (strain ATCC 30010 / Neff) TaxID=1257118 RepID=L8GMP3_ACACF|nr:tetratricopeptide repeat domain containing protein [Acanthamoeba castellanii str. Neff]ELR14079.1 tetratricopeptide repeat domain containing protein [Acanthamoeba castellanii str. Neff]
MEGLEVEGPVFVTQELVPEHARALLREELHHCDPKLPALLEQLGKHGASECWHKHGTFKQHLFGVWRILYLWKQSQAVCRCGLYHSAYSNSYVNLAIFKPDTGRETVRSAVGNEAEELIHFFCTIPRQELIFDHILPLHPDKPIPKEGVEVRHIRNKDEKIRVSPKLMKISLLLTIADFCDQWYGWQDLLFANEGGLTMSGDNPATLWPSTGKPGLWMSRLSQMAVLSRRIHEQEPDDEPLPPIFNNCSTVLEPDSEREARDLYWRVVMHKTEQEQHEEAAEDLRKAIALNPFVAEPRVLLAQIYNVSGRYEEAESQAQEALRLLFEWGTAWDKVPPWLSLLPAWFGWIAWARINVLKARRKEWPSTSFGIINLGLV